MSKVFYDDIIDLKDVEKQLKRAVKDYDERVEIYKLIDDILHHRLLSSILEKLPKENHKEFVQKFCDHPHDESHIEYLTKRINQDMKEFIKSEARVLSTEILAIIFDKTKPNK